MHRVSSTFLSPMKAMYRQSRRKAALVAASLFLLSSPVHADDESKNKLAATSAAFRPERRYIAVIGDKKVEDTR